MANEPEYKGKQRMFVAEYLIDLNATQAAIRAGYSKKTAGKIGPGNLAKLVISQTIAEVMSNCVKKVRVKASDVQVQLDEMHTNTRASLLTYQGSYEPVDE